MWKKLCHFRPFFQVIFSGGDNNHGHDMMAIAALLQCPFLKGLIMGRKNAEKM